jgi:hypothetical protein
MFKTSIKMQIKGDYDWDIDDPYDLFFITFLALFAAILWPLTLAVGLLMAGVKKMYVKGNI